MKIETAFSLDCGMEVNAEDAYDFFWAGIIKDKRNFRCISEDCDAQITCANLDKLREDMKVAPYFKAFGKHSDLCSLIKEAEFQPYLRKDSNETSSTKAKISEELPDIFELERPEEHIIIKEKSLESDNVLDIEEIKKRKKSRNTNDAIRSRKYYSIRGLIKKYYEYKQNNTLDRHFIKIPVRQAGGYVSVSYSEMFVEINGQDFSKLPEYKRIYFGLAKFYDNGTHYNIKFTKVFVRNGKNIKPSIYISQKVVSEAFCSKLAEKKLQNLSGKTIYCFVYSKPLPAENKYINLNVNSMDLLDIKKKLIAPILRSNRDRSSSAQNI